MSERSTGSPIRRILVAQDASSTSLAALEAAVHLARILGAEVTGLYVEDVNLLHFSRLPFAAEIGSSSGLTRRLTADTVERLFKSQARRAQSSLAALADEAHVRWSFKVKRGQVVAELLNAASDADLISLGAIGWSRWNPGRLGTTTRALLDIGSRPLLLMRAALDLERAVLVLYDGTAESDAALELAVRLAPAGSLAVLVPASSPPEPAERLSEQAVRRLEQLGATGARVQRVDLTQPGTLAELARSAGFGLFIVASSSLPEDQRIRDEWLSGRACPVLILK